MQAEKQNAREQQLETSLCLKFGLKQSNIIKISSKACRQIIMSQKIIYNNKKPSKCLKEIKNLAAF